MITLLIFTVLNTTFNIFVLVKINPFNISIGYNTTFWHKKLLGVWVYKGNRGLFYIPIRNEEKQKLKEDVERLISSNKTYQENSLSAMYSWLKTTKEKEKFRKNYSIVNKNYIDSLLNDN